MINSLAKTKFLDESETIISNLKHQSNQYKAKKILDIIISKYDDKLDYSVPVTNCIPLKSKDSIYKSVTITLVGERVLFHFPEEHRVAGKNLLNIYSVPSSFDKHSRTQINVKLEDLPNPSLLEQTIEYSFEHLR
jgi:hypothetical protein